MPNTTTDQELQHLRNALPDSVVIQRVEERLSALGNCIVTNDHVALVHTDLDRVSGRSQRIARVTVAWRGKRNRGRESKKPRNVYIQGAVRGVRPHGIRCRAMVIESARV